MSTILYTAGWTKQKQISLILKKIMKSLLTANLGSVNADREVRRENRVLKDRKVRKVTQDREDSGDLRDQKVRKEKRAIKVKMA